MKTVYNKIAVALTALSLAFAAQAFAQSPAEEQPGEPQGPQKGEFIQKMIDELGLTEKQVQEITQNKENNQQQSRALHEKAKEIRNAIRTELEKTTTNEKTLKKMTTDLKNVQGDMVDQHIKGILELKKTLTPEQFKEFNQKMEQKREKFSQFRGKMGERLNERSKPCPETEQE